jgi:hypothetical protein
MRRCVSLSGGEEDADSALKRRKPAQRATELPWSSMPPGGGQDSAQRAIKQRKRGRRLDGNSIDTGAWRRYTYDVLFWHLGRFLTAFLRFSVDFYSKSSRGLPVSRAQSASFVTPSHEDEAA